MSGITAETRAKVPKDFHTIDIVVFKVVRNGMSIDVYAVYRLLKTVKEYNDKGIKPYPRQIIYEKGGFSYATLSKYITLLEQQGLLEVEREGKKMRLKITRKGLDFLYMISRGLALLGVEE